MVTTALVDSLIKDGKVLLDELQRQGIQIEAALWLYDTDSEEWRLSIASSELLRRSREEAYAVIQNALMAIPKRSITLSNVTISALSDPIVKALRSVITIDSVGAGIRISRSAFNNVYIEDAYIYLLKR
jgi:hypothetical protein